MNYPETFEVTPEDHLMTDSKGGAPRCVHCYRRLRENHRPSCQVTRWRWEAYEHRVRKPRYVHAKVED